MPKSNSVFLKSLIIATATEFLGLFFWVYLVDRGDVVWGVVIALAGLLAERISVYMLIHAVWGQNPPHKNLIITLGFSGVGEAVGWFIWLFLADGQLGLTWASLILGVILLLEHSMQIGYFMRINLLKHVTDPSTILFSAIEGIVAFLWLHFVRHDQTVLAILILLGGLTIEHIIQGSVIRKGRQPH